jgi:proteasome accessory factor C
MSDNTKTHRVLRFILFLSNGYPKTREECREFLGIKDTAFYSYCNLLRDTGFDLHQKEGRYCIDYSEHDFPVLRKALGFSEEELYMLSKTIDLLEVSHGSSVSLKKKLVSFLNHDEVLENYLSKHKSEKILLLQRAIGQKKQVLLRNYSSGNSDSVRNRLVEPFEFKDDFNLLWAFDVELMQNRQFKVCRTEDIIESPLDWQYGHLHRSKPVDIFRNTGELNKNVELVLNLRAMNLLTEEYPLSERYLKKIKANKFELKAPVAKYEGPARFVMGLAENISIKGDAAFLEFIGDEMKKISRLLEIGSRNVEI